jgi:outer membrane protein assembly factor BamB
MTAALAFPTANAHTPIWKITSYAYLMASPNPVGVGQRVAIVMWVDTPMPGALVTNDIKRHDYKLTITAPDGTKEVMNWPVITDPTSIQYTSWTPDQTGTYTMLFEYPQQTYTWEGDFQGDIFTAASATTTLTVQEEPLPQAKTSYPLPSEYWTRPIEGQNTDWYAVSSNWLGSPYVPGAGTSYGIPGAIQMDGVAPNSPHIMWSRPIGDGGVVGGNNMGINGTTYYMGGSYNTRFSNALIMYGRLYYELPLGNSGGGGGYICVDLRTGEEIWYRNFGYTERTIPGYGTFRSAIVPSFGYLYRYDDGNQHGVLPDGLLFTNNFAQAIDPSTGDFVDMNWTNIPSGAAYVGPKGEILRLQLNSQNKWMAEWNSSKMNVNYEGQIGVANWYTGTVGGNTPNRYDWNVTIPNLGPGSWSVVGPNLGATNCVNLDDMVLLMQGSLGMHVGGFGGTISEEGANITAVSLKSGSRGTILWTKHYDVAPGNVSRSIVGWDPEAGIFVMHDKETMVFTGYSLEDGRKVWGPTEATNDYTYFRDTTMIAYGKIYFAGYGGILYCYDVKDGNLLWTYGNGGPGNSTFAGLETAWGTYPIFVDVIADGKLYLATTEHSPDSPYYKDTKYRCVNATTGEEIWTLMGWGTGMDAACDVIADGFFVFLNCYDMQIYCVGKGPSATTVSIQNDVTTYGNKVLVKGAVTDIAAGTKQNEQAARFPYGVPAVSDESMEAWMEYVYMQKPRPADVVGVNVTISVLDPNGNTYEVGKTTSDADGMYKCVFTPPVPGEYTVIATFDGSESFWPSHASTALYVDEVPETTPSPPPTPAPMTDMYVTGFGIGMILAIAVVGLLLVMMLRKR